MASQISKILPTLLIIAAAFLLNFGCCQQNESQTTETLAATYVSSSTEALPLNTTIAFSNETTTEATPSPTEAGTNSTTVAAATTTAQNRTWLWFLIGGIVSIVVLCGLVACIMCYMRRGSQQLARETVSGESGTVTTFKDSTMSQTMNVVDKSEHHEHSKASGVTSTNCCSQSVGSSVMVWQQPTANLQLSSFRGENEVLLDDDMSTTGSIAMSTTALGGSSMAVPTDYMSKMSGESGSGSSTTFKDSAMNGNNAATNSSIASQTTSKQEGGGANVPDSLHSVTMVDLAKVNARLAQRKKQQQAPKQ
ncbi:hypothetical protein niasHS_007886 [Heterodera schachtii]|uniref:Uncharacterized protein n=1 Tax=Heterodera schachtii TaxID=97005 RepID=A0ABD2JQ35_HETSC